MHLTDAQIDQLRHHELRGRAGEAARTHIAGCADCARREAAQVDEDRAIADALTLLDRALPVGDPAAVTSRSKRRGARPWRLMTAGAVLLAATAAAAMPRSPLRRWFAAAERRADTPTLSSPSAPTAVATDAPSPRSIAIAAGDSLDLVFAAWQNGGTVTLRLTREAEVRLATVDSSVVFAVGRSLVRVRNNGSVASYQAFVPLAVRRLRVLVDGSVVLERERNRLVIGPAPDAVGQLTIDLARRTSR